MKIIGVLLAFISLIEFCDSSGEKLPILPNIKIAFRLAEDKKVAGFEEKEYDGAKIYLNPKHEIVENDIRSVQQFYNDQMQRFDLHLEMYSNGAQKFADLTANNIGKKLAIIVNGKILLAPVINSEILGGKVQITGRLTSDEVEELFITLTGGEQ